MGRHYTNYSLGEYREEISLAFKLPRLWIGHPLLVQIEVTVNSNLKTSYYLIIYLSTSLTELFSTQLHKEATYSS